MSGKTAANTKPPLSVCFCTPPSSAFYCTPPSSALLLHAAIDATVACLLLNATVVCLLLHAAIDATVVCSAPIAAKQQHLIHLTSPPRATTTILKNHYAYCSTTY